MPMGNSPWHACLYYAIVKKTDKYFEKIFPDPGIFSHLPRLIYVHKKSRPTKEKVVFK